MSKGETGTGAVRALKAGLRRSFLLAGIFSLVVNLLMLTVPIYMLQVFDRVLMSRSEETLVLLTIMAAGALAVLGVFDALRGQVLARLGAWSERRLGGEVYGASVMRALATGQASGQGLRDLAHLRGFLSGPALVPMMDAPWTPIFIAVIFLMHPVLGWFALAGALVLLVLVFVNEISTRHLQLAASEASMGNNRAAELGLRNADAIGAMGMLPNLVRRWEEGGADSTRLSRKVAGRASGLTAISKFLRLLLQMGILGLGGWLVIQAEITGGAMIAGSILLGRALAPIEMAVGSWRQSVQGIAAWKRVCALLETHPLPDQATALPQPEGHLAVENVTLVYPGQQEPIVRGVSCELKPGEAMAIIGPSAAGKTTLARLIVGNLAPRLGAVRLDGADLASYAAAARMRDIGYLPQDVELFPGTVRENIARMGAGSDTVVMQATRLAGVHEIILSLPNGYDTVVGEGGVRLSGGQRQMVGLARALFGAPCLVVLDEPNANLDQGGEAMLIRTLRTLKHNGVTLLVISHRTSIIRHVDRVMLLKAGKVETIGPPAEVLKKLVRPAGRQAAAAAATG